MATSQAAKEINRNNKNQRVDQFYVSFLKLPENVSNLLGKQTKMIDRPNLTFETSMTNHRHNQFQDMNQVRFDPVSVTLFDDENGLTRQYIYTQLFRQLNRGADVFGRWDVLDRDYRFDVKMEMFNSVDELIEGYVLRDCFISSIDHTQMSTDDEDTETEITIILTYNNIDFFIVNEYVEFKGGIPMEGAGQARTSS